MKDGDPETVMQLELTVGALLSGEDATYVAFDTFNPNAEIVIYEALYIAVNEMLAGVTDLDAEKAFDAAVVAKAKPVSYADGILTVDVFSKNGDAGAKMVAIQVDDFEELKISSFYFDLPEGMLSASASGQISAAARKSVNVSGLQTRTLALPSLVKKLAKDFMSGNYSGLLGKAIFILPLALIIVPILLKTLETKVQKIYSIYGIDVHPVFVAAKKALRNILQILFDGLR